MTDHDREYCSACGTIWLKRQGHKCPGPGVGYATPTQSVTVQDRYPSSTKWTVTPDNPINPSHYTSGAMEHWDYFKSTHTLDECIGAARYAITKYEVRLGKKDAALQDAEKLLWWARELVSLLREKAESERE